MALLYAISICTYGVQKSCSQRLQAFPCPPTLAIYLLYAGPYFLYMVITSIYGFIFCPYVHLPLLPVCSFHPLHFILHLLSLFSN